MIEVLGPVDCTRPHTVITICKQPTVLPWLRKVPLAVGQYVVNGDVRMYLADRLGKRLAAAGVLRAEYVDPNAELTAVINSKKNPPVDTRLMGFITSKLEQRAQEEQHAQVLALLQPPDNTSTPESQVVQVNSQLTPVDPDDDFTKELSPLAAALMRESAPSQLETPTIGTPAPAAPEPETMLVTTERGFVDEIPVVSAEAMAAAAITPKKRKRRTAAEMEAARAAEALVEPAPTTEPAAPAPMDILTPETPGST